ncbi:winged helix DNA-binding domain-containing protein [Thermomonospora amylolytica]|uniref:winged helix DNA-binding domain-containing protein n=1 Tax=Thermomonospora amylolytica TaxID=1411117 RepID=UPI000E6D262A|nr:winged helix DNA-binding domain-containing protein [Thermomonospora amylolytica]
MAVLTTRALNRATLERQRLLRRVDQPPRTVVEHLTGLQAQDPPLPYLGLWARIRAFDKDALTRLLHDRTVVRATLHRGTQHLVLAQDYLWLRPTLAPMLDRRWRTAFRKATEGVDPARLTATVHDLLAQSGSLTRPQLAAALAERWPDHDGMQLAWAAQGLLPIVHPPPSGTWGHQGPTPFALAETWLGRRPDGQGSPETLIRRHLAAFGPATVRDIQAWSGLTRLNEVVDRIRPTLRVHRGETGAELLDLPGAPLPDPDTPAPPRFLPALDNVVIGYADRSRLMTDEERRRVVVEAPLTADGFLCGFWRIERQGPKATLHIDLTRPLAARRRGEVAAEGERLLRFTDPDAAARDIAFKGHHT